MGNKLTFKDLSFENALDELTDKRHNKPGKDKYGYCRIFDTPVSRYEDFLWFNTIDEMKDHILNA